MTTHSATDIQIVVETDLSRIIDERVARAIRELLVVPYPVERTWDYGAPGETRKCWTVFEHRASNTGIAYAADGFVDRWGLVFLFGIDMSMGMDASWFAYLEDAFRASPAWSEGNPPGYEVP